MTQAITEIFREAKQDYELASFASQPGSRRTRAGSLGVDADHHIKSQADYMRMIAFVRELERNDPLISQALRRLVSNVQVGGMQPSPDTGDERINKHLKDRWAEYSSDPEQCDATGRMTFEVMANVAFRRVVIDGDMFAVPRADSAAVLNLESHRCQTPATSKIDRGICGISLDKLGKPQTYYLTKQTLPAGQIARVSDVEAIQARTRDGWLQVFHVFRPDRFSLTRGVTSLAPIASNSSRRSDLEFATILKAQVGACVTFIEEDGETAQTAPPDLTGGPVGPTASAVDAAGYAMRTAAMHAGRVLEVRTGKKLRMETPNIPGTGQLELNNLLIQYLAANLDLPKIVLLLDAKEANFSAYRNVLDQARLSYGEIQRWFSAQYHRRIYQNAVRVWAKSDEVLRSFLMQENPDSLLTSGLLRHSWMPQGWSYQHPVDDAQGDILLLSNSMQSLRRFFAKKYGADVRTEVQNIVTDNGLAIRAAITEAQAIAKETGVEVDWQYLFPMPNRQGLQMSITDQPGNDEEDLPEEPADSETDAKELVGFE